MDELRYTLLSDGTTNKALIPISTWVLREHLPHLPIQGEWADLRRLPKPPPRSRLDERIRLSVDLFPCDLLFVHRDAENARYQRRVSEINRAVETARGTATIPPTVCVIPVRMLEAWLLFDELAIRRAAGNPSGTMRLSLPFSDGRDCGRSKSHAAWNLAGRERSPRTSAKIILSQYCRLSYLRLHRGLPAVAGSAGVRKIRG